MHDIILDEEFMMYLPKLDKETFESLEKQLLSEGARDPLVVWNNILIDGYNRHNICIKHGIAFTTVSMEFNSREDALEWIIDNQLSRRNLSPIEVSHFRGVLFNSAKRKRGSSNQYTEKVAFPQSEGKQTRLNTATEVGKRFKVSRATIERDGKVAEALNAIAAVSLDAKQKVLSGEVPVDRSKLQRLSKASQEEITKVADQINSGTYNRSEHRVSRAGDTSPEQGNASNAAQQSTLGTNPFINDNLENSANSNEIMTGDFDETAYVDTMVSLITGNLNTVVQTLNNDSGVRELKSSLRTLINSLEEMYSNIIDE
ncbi:MAG: hypothetical protein FWE83_08460 [Oscillospiraceae bacterium]|nr:hypothetical protein [Oscillospiraceae bacterium]